MAAVVGLETVARSPERIDALLPPYRPTAHRVSAAQLEPEIPRIRYPVAVHPGNTSQSESPESIRIAAAPPKAEVPPTAKSDPAAAKDWLVDPKEWYAPDGTTGAAASDANSAGANSPGGPVGGVSDADRAKPLQKPIPNPTYNPKAKPPSASQTPPIR